MQRSFNVLRSSFTATLLIMAILCIGSITPKALGGVDDFPLLGQIGGGCNKVVTQGRYAYVKGGSRLTVVDVINPDAPVIKGYVVLPDPIRNLAVFGKFVAIADGDSGLQIVDVSNPLAPFIKKALNTRGIANDVAIWNGMAYVACGDTWYGGDYGEYYNWGYSSGNIFIVDMRQPDNTTVINSEYGDSKYVFDSISVSNGIACVSYNSDENQYPERGLKVFDVTNPLSTKEKSTYRMTTKPGALVFSNNQAFITQPNAKSNATENRLRVVDFSNPQSPILRWSYKLQSLEALVTLSGHTVYVTDGAHGLKTFDVSNPVKPELKRAIPIGGELTSIAVTGELAYATTYTESGNDILQVINLNNGAVPVMRGRLTMLGYVFRFAAYESMACVDNGNRLNMVDMSQPKNPKLLATCKTTDTQAFTMSNKNVFAIDNHSLLHIIDIKNPAKPMEVGSCKVRESAHAIAYSSTAPHVYVLSVSVSEETEYLQVVDIVNQSRPKLRGTYKFQAKTIIFDIASSGNLVYCAADEGLIIIDVSNPSSPKWLGTYHTRLPVQDVSLSGDVAYLTFANIYEEPQFHALEIVDISNPNSPRLKGLCGNQDFYPRETDRTESFSVSNGLACLIASVNWRQGDYNYSVEVNDHTLEVFDVRNSYAPRLIGKNHLGGKDIYSFGDTALSKKGIAYIASSYYDFRTYPCRPVPLELTQPRGGESFLRGTTQMVTWNSDESLTATVTVDLYAGDKYYKRIARRAPNTGWLLWGVPSDLPLGSGYKVKLTANSDPVFNDISLTTFTLVNWSDTPQILTSPSGVNWVAGKPFTVRWKPNGKTYSYLAIEIYKGGQFIRELARVNYNKGSYTGNVPADLPTGSDYVTCITPKYCITKAGDADAGPTPSIFNSGTFTITNNFR